MNENKLMQHFEKRGFDLLTACRLAAFWLWIKREEGDAVSVDEFDCKGGIDGLCECDSYRHDCLVLTDDEADRLEDEYLDSYIEDCLEIPENMTYYFDEDAWKRDARMDGRGHILSSWDGNEHEVEFLGTTYYIFKQ